MSKELIVKAEQIRDEVRVGANTAKRVGGFLEEMAREVNGLYDNVLDWINNERPQGGGFILTQSDVVNSLVDESQLKPLSAMQGKILKAVLDSLVVDDLVTDDETKALSARQGKSLAEEIRGLSDVYQPLGKYQAAGDYADAVHTHTAAQVTEQANKRFMTDAERESLSSLGTSYAKADMSNIADTRFSVGTISSYIKFSNGLLICWGWMGMQRAENKTVYLPLSFTNDSYKVTFTSESSILAGTTLISLTVNNKTVSSFKVKGAFHTIDVSSGYPSEAFDWIAIGQWE